MKIVYTKDELKIALASGEKRIVIKGDFAKKISKTARTSKLVSAAIVAAALAAVPLTGGTSMGLVVGSVSISTVELAILIGGSIAIFAIRKGYKKIKFCPDGSVELNRDN